MLSEPVHGISDSVVCATSKALDQPAQSGQSLCLSIECSVTVGMLTGRRLEFLCLGVGGLCGFVWVCACREATLLEVSHATAHLLSHPFVHLCLRNFRSQDYLIE